MAEITEYNPTEDKAQEPLCTTSVAINGDLQKRCNRMTRVFFLSAIVIGCLLLCAYIVLDVVLEVRYADWHSVDGLQSYQLILNLMLWFGCLLFCFGWIFYLVSNRNAHAMDKLGQGNVYRFYVNAFTVTSLKGEEETGTVKTYYRDLLRVRENREFFLLYPNSVAFYPVDKKVLSKEERAILRTVLPVSK